MSITYECILLGTFEETVLDKVRNKLRVTCEAYDELDMRDVVLTVRAGPNTTNGRMVLSKEGESSDTNWKAVRVFRAEPSTRYNPQVLIRSTIQLPLDTPSAETALTFVTSLGYNRSHEYSKRGWVYTCNKVKVSVYQLYNADGQLVHDQNVWMTEVRSQPVIPDQSAVVDPLKVAINSCLKLKSTLQPFVHLKRVEH
ncbi:hypothetical protein E3P99_03103 [Wallemia hederae]|uniref:Mediator of RNA polymerase II transcription subunit 18 n=1 Tax=Wallemia hederae TaxID=1540922 RepID=A0A4T0FHW2_9BASI|nr:hypothetical protein E3P99_03103 [Wallemia hederae]